MKEGPEIKDIYRRRKKKPPLIATKRNKKQKQIQEANKLTLNPFNPNLKP